MEEITVNKSIKKNINRLAILFIFLLNSWVLANDPNTNDIGLRIDFSSGSTIVNEIPIIVSPVGNYAINVGTKDTLIGLMTSIFNDAENGSQLKYKAISQNKDVATISIIPSDGSIYLHFNPRGVKGQSTIILTANDGAKEVSDTFSVVVKDRFDLSGMLADTLVRSKSERLIIAKDISFIMPDNTGDPKETYTFTASSDDTTLISVTPLMDSNVIRMEIADSGFGSASISVTVIDSDSFMVSDTFTLTVKKSYGISDYYRKRVPTNLGLSLFSGLDYTGFAFRIWINDIFGIGANGYYQWDQNGMGADLQLLVKPPLQFVLQPYFMGSGGYHHQILHEKFELFSISVEREIPLFVARVALGVDGWVGKTKQNVFGIEAGYSYGEAQYSTISAISVGESELQKEERLFKIPPFHFKMSYTFYFKKL
jgi:hypothetical protein